MNENSLTINIEILQRPYYVKVKRQDEEIYRKAGQTIEKSVQKYAAKGAVYRDKQDLLAMALLENTLIALTNEQKIEEANLSNSDLEKLHSINNLLSSNLN